MPPLVWHPSFQTLSAMPLLADLASIHTGYVRGRTKHVPEGRYRVVSAGDLDRNHRILYKELTRSDDVTPSDRHLLREGDVLFVPRGAKNVAAHVDIEADNLVASSQLYVIRTADEVDAGFLTWYLNHHRAQAYFDVMARGTTIRSINKKVLGELTIPLPPVKKQQRIVEIARLGYEEARLLNELQDKRSTLIETLLLQTTNQYE